MKIKFIRKEVYSQKQRRFFCASEDPELKKMCDDPMKEEQLDEMSSMGGGAVQGAVASSGGPWATEEDEIKKFNEKEKKDSKLKGKPLEELYSTSAPMSAVGYPLTDEEETHHGNRERAKQQGNRSVVEEKKDFHQQWKKFLTENDETETMAPIGRPGENPNINVANDLKDMTEDPSFQSRVAEVYYEIADAFEVENLVEVVMNDKTSRERVDFMIKNMNYEPELYEKIRTGDPLALEEYYLFIINEFSFLIKAKGLAAAYVGRNHLLGKGWKSILYGMTWNYIQNPNKYNPHSRSIALDSEADFYNLDKDLSSSSYKLPQE